MLEHKRAEQPGPMDYDTGTEDVPFSRECAATVVPQPMPYPPWRRDLPGLMLGAPCAPLRPLLPPFFEAGAAKSSSVASNLACVSKGGARGRAAQYPRAFPGHRPRTWGCLRHPGCDQAALDTRRRGSGRARRARAGKSGQEWPRQCGPAAWPVPWPRSAVGPRR